MDCSCFVTKKQKNKKIMETELRMFRNLDTPKGNMVYEIQRVLSFFNVNMLLTASYLSDNGFFYNSKTKKVTCFSCAIEYDTNVYNIKHGPSCKHKEKNIPVYVDKNVEDRVSSFKPSSAESITNKPSSPPISSTELDMKKESDRLKTFTMWDENVPVEPVDLARNGFYFKGFADVVVCAYCMLELRNWEEGDIVYNEHKRHSPRCSHLDPVLEVTDGNPPIQNMKLEPNRLKSFNNVSDAFAVCIKALAKNGFYFLGFKDRVCCSSCNCKINNWKKDDNIKQRHQSVSPNCQFVQNNATAGLTHYHSNVILDRPKHPQFALFSDRLKTFTNWSSLKKQTPELLAEAGFYHTGEIDTVICYSCDGGLCNWEEEDDPWIEHARWYPRCTYVRQKKGDKFVASVKRDEFSSSSEAGASASSPSPENTFQSQSMTSTPATQEHTPTLGPKTTFSLKNNPTFLAVTQLGYDETVVEYVVKKKIKETAQLTEHPSRESQDSEYDTSLRQLSTQVAQLGNLICVVKHLGTDGSGFSKASLLLDAVVIHIKEVGPVVSKSQQEEFEDQVENPVQPEINPKQDHKLKEENRLLKEQKTCKICLDEELSIVFLPCGHFVSCATCALSLKTCPLCRSQILGLVRAYMS